MTEAFLEGMLEGAAMGMLFCAAAAMLATSMLTVMLAYTAASSVFSFRFTRKGCEILLRKV